MKISSVEQLGRILYLLLALVWVRISISSGSNIKSRLYAEITSAPAGGKIELD